MKRGGILFLMVLIAGLIGPGWAPVALAQKGYSMVFRGGGRMTARYIQYPKTRAPMGGLTIYFQRAPVAATRRSPGPGTCAWLDRPLRSNEPNKMFLARPNQYISGLWIGQSDISLSRVSGKDLKYLLNAMRSGKKFYVRCYNRKGQEMRVTRTGLSGRGRPLD